MPCQSPLRDSSPDVSLILRAAAKQRRAPACPWEGGGDVQQQPGRSLGAEPRKAGRAAGEEQPLGSSLDVCR